MCSASTGRPVQGQTDIQTNIIESGRQEREIEVTVRQPGCRQTD